MDILTGGSDMVQTRKSRTQLTDSDKLDESVESMLRDAIVAGARDA